MPQLDPALWFLIFVSSWLIILTLTPVKILPHKNPNDPLLKTFGNLKKAWTWPWP